MPGTEVEMAGGRPTDSSASQSSTCCLALKEISHHHVGGSSRDEARVSAHHRCGGNEAGKEYTGNRLHAPSSIKPLNFRGDEQASDVKYLCYARVMKPTAVPSNRPWASTIDQFQRAATNDRTSDR